MEKYDIIIIGAGPAGSTAARLLAEKNYKVLLLDKEKFPREKPCGGGLPYKIEELFDFPIDDYISKISDNTRFLFNQKKPIHIKKDGVSIKMVMRPEFDNFLVDKALEKGANVKFNSLVKEIEEQEDAVLVKTGKENFHASFVIGADGANSLTVKSTGLLSDRKLAWALSAEVYVSDKQLKEQGTTTTIDFGCIPKGYGWIFPKKDHLSCGIGTECNKIKDFKKILFDFLQDNETIRNYKNVKVRGHGLPISYRRELKINTDRILLVGDAASLIDPLTGEGIYHAIKSSQIAVSHILNKIKNNELSLDNYSTEINNSIRNDLFYAGKFADKLHSMPEFVYNLRITTPLVQSYFLDLLTGAVSYEEVYWKIKRYSSGKILLKPFQKIFRMFKKA